MSFLKALIAAWIWTMVTLALAVRGVEISEDTLVLTIAIIVAGALAGGEK